MEKIPQALRVGLVHLELVTENIGLYQVTKLVTDVVVAASWIDLIALNNSWRVMGEDRGHQHARLHQRVLIVHIAR